MLYAFSGSSCIMYLFFVHFDIVVFLFPVKFISRLGKVCVKCCICVCIVVAFAKFPIKSCTRVDYTEFIW